MTEVELTTEGQEPEPPPVDIPEGVDPEGLSDEYQDGVQLTEDDET